MWSVEEGLAGCAHVCIGVCDCVCVSVHPDWASQLQKGLSRVPVYLFLFYVEVQDLVVTVGVRGKWCRWLSSQEHKAILEAAVKILSFYSAVAIWFSAFPHQSAICIHTWGSMSIYATNICRVGTSGWCTEDIRKSTESAESTLMLCKSSPSVESHCSVAHNSCANTFSSKNRCLGCWCIWNGPRSKRQLFCSKDSPPLGWALKTCFLYWSGAFCGWWGYEHQMPHTHLQRCPRQQRGWADKDSPVRLKVMSGIQT